MIGQSINGHIQCLHCEKAKPVAQFTRRSFVKSPQKSFSTCNACSARSRQNRIRYGDKARLSKRIRHVVKKLLASVPIPSDDESQASSHQADVSEIFLRDLYQQANRCVYCDVSMKTRGPSCLALTQRDPSLGCVRSNVSLCCQTCLGLRDEDYSFEEFKGLRGYVGLERLILEAK